MCKQNEYANNEKRMRLRGEMRDNACDGREDKRITCNAIEGRREHVPGKVGAQEN